VLYPRFSASDWAGRARRSGATVTNLLGATLAFICAQPPSPDDRAHKIRCIYAAPLSTDLAGPFSERFGVREFVDGFGQTEISNVFMTPPGAPRPPGASGVLVDAVKLASVLDEGTTITINSPDNGEASVSINGTGEDAMALANLLKMAGLFASDGYHSACSSCGPVHEGDCRVMEEGLANSADNTETMSMDYMVNDIAGGLNGPKLQVNPNNAGDNPLAMGDLGRKSSPAVNLGAMAEQVQRESEDRLLELYKRIV
jgi:hypothetical protein